MAEAAQGYTSTDWIDPSKIGAPNWLPLEDAFQQMLVRAGSGELAADDLYAWLRSRDWLSVELRVNADGRKTCRRLTADFWRDIARLEAVPDADAVDRLKIHFPDLVDPSSLFDWHTSFWGRAAEFARELERLYPAILYPTTAALPSSAVAPAVGEVATQDVSREAQGVDPFNTGAGGRPSAMEFVLSEAKRRIDDGEVEVVRGKQVEFADALAAWWEKKRKTYNPPGPKITGKTIRNNEDFRSLWRQALAAKIPKPPT
jgi:hypothetical protein